MDFFNHPEGKSEMVTSTKAVANLSFISAFSKQRFCEACNAEAFD